MILQSVPNASPTVPGTYQYFKKPQTRKGTILILGKLTRHELAARNFLYSPSSQGIFVKMLITSVPNVVTHMQ